MTDLPKDPVTTATDRLTEEGATPGEDPREIDAERSDPVSVAAAQADRHVRHSDQIAQPVSEMGTSSARDIDAGDPLERDA